MFRRAIIKKFILFIMLTITFMVFCGSSFIYAADISTDEPFDVTSSPVNATDLTKYFNMDLYNDVCDAVFLRTDNNSVLTFGTLSKRMWSYTLPSGFNYDSFYTIGSYNEGLTLVNNYRYVIKVEILMRTEFADGTSSLMDCNPYFVLYSEYTDSGDFITQPIEPTKIEIVNDRRICYFDFVFDANSLFNNPYIEDKPVMNEDGTYSFNGYGFYIGQVPDDADLTSFRIVWNQRESYVFSPEDYMAYYTLTNLWNMGIDQSTWVDDSVDNATIESGNALDGLGDLVLPDIDEASGYADPFVYMDPSWFDEFNRILSPITDNPLVSILIILAAIFCMISYVLFGKKV